MEVKVNYKGKKLHDREKGVAVEGTKKRKKKRLA